ncbi:hypothetical protein JCM19046_4426 [Bacillus sp. JCM 19046]|uniref:Uncharacterized protein n=1 Tax=Shouchella xiaoxiensis TaxID=766895 RepID=A0ABS2SQF7_9BACI|nr:hypothetical protein [Shouchella xiaoxiensis]MBM7837753.1 hypothetical protein [Shouchella xiaoxiensis]GAF15255.1 hypothetical protein JCM19045_4605 [Bacillus sp. JCM 19045]GAF19750.1 hypothetical protein JCM19046_4426 [Bacillus sp. JCM 19046]
MKKQEWSLIGCGVATLLFIVSSLVSFDEPVNLNDQEGNSFQSEQVDRYDKRIVIDN